MKRKNIVEIIKQNPIIKFITFLVIIIAFFVTWIKNYYDEKLELAKIKYDNTISELNIKLNSIPRDKEYNDYLNITKMFANKNSFSSINPNCTYFVDDKFYALKETEFLKYKKYTQKEYEKEIFNDESYSELNDAIVHFWAPTTIKYFNGLNEKKIASPTIYLTKLNKAKLSILVEVMATNAEIQKNITNILKKRKFLNEMDKDNFYTESMENSLKIFKSNILSVVFYNTFGSMIYSQQYDENISFEIQNVVKIKNIYYLQSLDTLKNVILDEIKYPEYYVRNEMYLTSNNNEIFIIAINIPSREPIVQNSIYYNEITKWLNNFVIIID